ncbi:MAG: AtpZ/AtpI family protein [Syntrophaceae bacterium]|nr:AtpZ/AtpI family protein [Syntrophaceae bacterium]
MDKETKKSLVQMTYASSVGFFMVIVIFGGLYLGNYLDRKFGTAPYFTILLLSIGVFAGFRNVYLLIKKFKDDTPFIKGIKSEPHRKRPPPAKN